MELSAKVVDAPAKLRATLLHELCHVAGWLLPPHVVRSLLGLCYTGWVRYEQHGVWSSGCCYRKWCDCYWQCMMRPLDQCHTELLRDTDSELDHYHIAHPEYIFCPNQFGCGTAAYQAAGISAFDIMDGQRSCPE